jgi:predicted Zn-dependent peptidase
MFATFANSHDGYGSFDDLDTASLEEVHRFFDNYYAPGNAVVTITGAVDPDVAMVAVDRYFSDIPERQVPQRPNFGEPRFDGERRVQRVDALAPLPALAIGYRVPDPIEDEEHYTATVVLANLLAHGSASRLFDRLVRRDKLASDVQAMWGGLDSAWTSRDPNYLAFIVNYADEGLTERILSIIDAEVETVSAGLPPSALDPVLAQLTSEHWMQVDSKYMLAVQAGFFELQRGDPQLAFELPDRLAAAAPLVSGVAAEWFAPGNRAVAILEPGGAS